MSRSCYDRRGCPSCKRVVCMYGADKCQSCTPKQTYRRYAPEPILTQAEAIAHLHANGFC